MFNRYVGLIKKDIVTGWRNYYFIIVIATALLFVFILNFVVPENASIKPTIYYYSDYEGDFKGYFQELIAETKLEHKKIYQVDSKKDIIKRMKDNSNSIGMVIKEIQEKPTIEFIMQGYENESVKNALLLAMKDDVNKSISKDINIDVVKLNKGSRANKVPMKRNILPLFLISEPIMLGFVLIIALIFMEKDEGTIRAYIVTPGKIPEYLLSKITLMVVLGLMSTLITSLLVIGFEGNYFSLMMLVIVGSVFASALGLIIASFFDNISQSIIWIIMFTFVMTLPFITYFVPSFAPMYIKILPTYPLLFAVRESLMPTGNSQIIYLTVLYLLILSVVSYILAIFSYKLSLARD